MQVLHFESRQSFAHFVTSCVPLTFLYSFMCDVVNGIIPVWLSLSVVCSPSHLYWTHCSSAPEGSSNKVKMPLRPRRRQVVARDHTGRHLSSSYYSDNVYSHFAQGSVTLPRLFSIIGVSFLPGFFVIVICAVHVLLLCVCNEIWS